jgi:hypothetical protein
MYTLTLILPKDRTELKKKYSEALANAVVEQLSPEELDLLIKKLEERDNS